MRGLIIIPVCDFSQNQFDSQPRRILIVDTIGLLQAVWYKVQYWRDLGMYVQFTMLKLLMYEPIIFEHVSACIDSVDGRSLVLGWRKTGVGDDVHAVAERQIPIVL